MQTVILQSGLQSGLSDVFYVTLANSLVKHVVSGYSQSPDPVRKQSGLSPERAKTIVFHMQTVISQSGLQSGFSDVFYVTLANSLVKRVVSGYSQSPDPVRKQSGLSPERAKTIVFHMY